MPSSCSEKCTVTARKVGESRAASAMATGMAAVVGLVVGGCRGRGRGRDCEVAAAAVDVPPPPPPGGWADDSAIASMGLFLLFFLRLGDG